MTNEELSGQLVSLRAGQIDALEEIYQELRTPVMTVVFRVVRSRELAEDLTQEVFLRLYRSPPGAEVHSPRAWVFRSAHNLALDALRRPGSEELPETAVVDFADSADMRLDVEAALGRLDERDRVIVTLHLNAGLRFREIAQAMDMPLGTVLWRYSRATERLRASLDGGAE